MRLFITSYQKSGTHQIVPAFGVKKHIVGRVCQDMARVEGWDIAHRPITERMGETTSDLINFKDRAFAHLPYLPEYAEALQAVPTKVLFNVRDPRDIVVANFYNINKVYYKGKYPGAKGLGHLNFVNSETKKLLIEMPDPISELIKIEAKRWPEWLGWLKHDFVMMVKYEDLRTNADEIVTKIAEFLLPYGIGIPTVVGNLRPQHSNPTFRAGRIGDWRREFNEQQKELANELFAETLEILEYET